MPGGADRSTVRYERRRRVPRAAPVPVAPGLASGSDRPDAGERRELRDGARSGPAHRGRVVR
jgi:hypothetical protein